MSPKKPKKRDFLKPEDVRSIRPGFGLAVKEYSKIIGLQLKKNANFGMAVKMSFFKEKNEQKKI